MCRIHRRLLFLLPPCPKNFINNSVVFLPAPLFGTSGTVAGFLGKFPSYLDFIWQFIQGKASGIFKKTKKCNEAINLKSKKETPARLKLTFLGEMLGIFRLISLVMSIRKDTRLPPAK